MNIKAADYQFDTDKNGTFSSGDKVYKDIESVFEELDTMIEKHPELYKESYNAHSKYIHTESMEEHYSIKKRLASLKETFTNLIDKSYDEIQNAVLKLLKDVYILRANAKDESITSACRDVDNKYLK